MVQASRQVRALVTLDRAVQSQTSSLSDRLRNTQKSLETAQGQLEKTAAAKKKAAPEQEEKKDKARIPVKEERTEGRSLQEEVDYDADEESEESYGVESEEEKETPTRTEPASSGVRPAPERPRSPEPRTEDRKRKAERDEPVSRERRRRGGRKHQGRHRILEEPSRVFHRHNNLERIDLGGRPRQTFYSRKWRWDPSHQQDGKGTL